MTNHSFLEKLAHQIVIEKKQNLTDLIIVLPNKRAKVFLLEAIKFKLTSYTFAPKIISVEDLIQDIAGIRNIDAIEILFEFYAVYLLNTKKEQQQNFEQFSNWAKTVLQDFNEIDRYLIKPEKVFSYLKEIEAIKRWGIEAKDKTILIDKNIAFWNTMPLYYTEFYKHLKQKKIGYQGLIYKEAVNNIDTFIKTIQNEHYIFAGFNALNNAEEKIIQSLLAINKAEIYWDIDQIFLEDKNHGAGLFARRFKKEWKHYKNNPFNWISKEFSEEKNIQIIGTSKSIGQTKIVASLLSDIIKANPNTKLENIAIILGDENLLVPILHSLPDNIGSLNITMGYSNKNNPIQQLVDRLFKMHKNALKRDPKSYVFYYKDILDVLLNPVVEPYLNSEKLISVLKKNNYSYVSLNKLKSIQENPSEFFTLLFTRWDQHPLIILENIKEILLFIKNNLDVAVQEDKLIKTFLYAVFKAINKLITYCSKNDFVNNIDTLEAIYKQVIDLAEVSFEGEPLMGLQIMGVLESRVLDFETVIITSLNEGKFPAGKTTNSFIPYDVKKELELPTFKEKDAIYTYHFYHILQRAKNIYLLYNTENDGLDGGEKSRFITQLEVEKQPNHTISHAIIQPSIPNIAYQKMAVVKSENVCKRLKEIATVKGFSPSSLTSYIRNPIQFYFQKVLSIYDNDEVEENIELKTLGIIIHQTLEELYKPFIDKKLEIKDIDTMFDTYENEVLTQFKAIYKEGEIKKGKNLLSFEVAKRNIKNFITEEKKNILNGDIIIILELESKLSVELVDPKLPFPVLISGTVDRIENRNGKIRIVDYKTGRVNKNDLVLKQWENMVFDLKNEKIIQVLCYALMYSKKINQMELEAGIVSFKNMKSGFLSFGIKEEKTLLTNITTEVLEMFTTEIIKLINEILDSNLKFEEIT